MPSNTRRMTAKQAQALDAYIATGSAKGAAKVIGVEPTTIDWHLSEALPKLPGHRRLHKLMNWYLMRAGAPGEFLL
jgi:hypothetical protein